MHLSTAYFMGFILMELLCERASKRVNVLHLVKNGVHALPHYVSSISIFDNDDSRAVATLMHEILP